MLQSSVELLKLKLEQSENSGKNSPDPAVDKSDSKMKSIISRHVFRSRPFPPEHFRGGGKGRT